MQADYQFWVLVGSQILSAGALFLQLNNKIDSKFDSLAKEVTEIKIEQAKQSGEIHRLGDKVDHLNQRIDFVYNLLPMPKLAIQVPVQDS